MNSTIDTFELTRNGKSLSGEIAVDRLERLESLLASPAGRIAWRLGGWRVARADGHDDFMELSFTTTLQPACVRCLQPVAVDLSVTRVYRLVGTEDEAQRLDPDEDDHDVIAGDSRFDLDALIEDEAIMELPPTAHHAHCDEAAPHVDVDPDPAPARENPFAALGRLRRKGGANGGGVGD